MALTAQQLAAALRLTATPATAVPPEHADVVSRLLLVTDELVKQYAPDAPEAVRDEARVRVAGYLYDRPPESPSAGAVFYSGAQGLLTAWRKQPRNADDPSVPVPPAQGGGGGLTAEQAEDLGNAVPYDGVEVSDYDLILPASDGENTARVRLPAITVEDEGVQLGTPETVQELNFTGGLVTATRNVDKVTINVSGDVGDFDESRLNGLIDARIPVRRRVPDVGAGDVGRILTAPQQAGGQPSWNSNPGQTAAQVQSAITTALAGHQSGGGQTQAQVNALIVAGVLSWARGVGRIPESALPPKVDDFADALSGGGFTPSGSDGIRDAFVSSHWSNVQAPQNLEQSPFAYVQSFNNGPLRQNLYLAIRVPVAVPVAELRVAVLEANAPSLYYLGATWHLVQANDGGYNYYTVQIPNAPVGVTIRAERFQPFALDGPKVGIESWATVGGGRVPSSHVEPSDFVEELHDLPQAIAIADSSNNSRTAFAEFTNRLTLQENTHGVLIVAASNWRITSGRAHDHIGPSDGVAAADVSANVYLSAVRATTPTAAELDPGNGIEIATYGLYPQSGDGSATSSLKVGDVTLRIARNANNNVGWYFEFVSARSSGSAAFTVQADLEVTLLRTDAVTPAAASSGLTRVELSVFDTSAQGRLNFSLSAAAQAEWARCPLIAMEQYQSDTPTRQVGNFGPFRKPTLGSGGSVDCIGTHRQTDGRKVSVCDFNLAAANRLEVREESNFTRQRSTYRRYVLAGYR